MAGRQTSSERAPAPIEGGFSKLFNRALTSKAIASTTHVGRGVYLVLAWRADQYDDFTVRGLGIGTIMQYSGLSRNGVRDGIADLCRCGLLRIVHPGRVSSGPGDSGEPATYQLLVPPVDYKLPPKLEAKPKIARRKARSPSNPPPGRPVTPSQGRQSTETPVADRTPPGSTSARVVRTEKKETNNREVVAWEGDGLGPDAKAMGDAAEAIAAEGVSREKALLLAGRRDPEYIHLAIQAVREKPRVKDRASYLVQWLTKRFEIPKHIIEQHNRAVAEERRREKEQAESVSRFAGRIQQASVEDEVDAWFAETDPDEIEAAYAEWRDSLPEDVKRYMSRRKAPSESRPFRAYVAERLEACS